MRLCLFTPVFLPDVGGTEVVTDALAREFVRLGHSVTVLATTRAHELDVPYDVRWTGRPIGCRRFPQRFSRHLLDLHRREPFDVIACNYAQPTGFAACRVREQLGVPIVITSHGGDIYRSSKHRGNARQWRQTQWTYQQADGLIAISPYLKQLLLEIQPAPPHIALIRNGVDVDEYRQPGEKPDDVDADQRFVLCLGNLGPMKGFDHAIEAWASAEQATKDLRLLIAGDGAMRGELAQLIRDRGMGDRIRMLGQRTGAAKRWLMQHCEFGMMPSIEEGLPLVALEFLASGKPLLASTNAAFDGLVDQANGVRVEAARPDLLAPAIEQMIRGDLAAMGEASRARSEQFRWPAVAEQYLTFFRQVLSTAA